MNPYLIIGLLVGWMASIVGVGLWQNDAGHIAERTVWQTRENTELRTANDKIISMQDSARRNEQMHAAALADVSTNYQKELNNANKQRVADLAAVRAGTLRLRIPVTHSIYSIGGSAAEIGAGASGCDGSERAELPNESAEFLLSEANRADQVVMQLTACQNVIIKDRAGSDTSSTNDM